MLQNNDYSIFNEDCQATMKESWVKAGVLPTSTFPLFRETFRTHRG